ncbi:ADP-ribosyltransferase [Chryseobacterium sp. FH2]|nr:ADP-ribosyltransferase [Chryseobacterium sp. FH2]
MKFYTTNAGYKNFNKALRGEIKITEFYKTQEKMMNEALEKLPIYESENLLYRIENLTDAQINEYYKVGKDIENKHFTSTSYSADAIAESMKKRPYSVLIRIESKNGRLIESLSIKREEKEIIFSSKTKFYVKEITNTNNPLDYSEIKTIKLIEK